MHEGAPCNSNWLCPAVTPPHRQGAAPPRGGAVLRRPAGLLRKEEGAFPAQLNTSAIGDKLKTPELKAARPKRRQTPDYYRVAAPPASCSVSAETFESVGVCAAPGVGPRECGENAIFFMEVTYPTSRTANWKHASRQRDEFLGVDELG